MRPVDLHTSRLVLDLPRLADAELVTHYCQDPLFERYLTTPWPYRRSDADAFLGGYVPDRWVSGAELTWALRRAVGGPLLGLVSVRDAAHEVGYWLGAEHRGAGLMSEAVSAVAEWALGGGLPGAETLLWRAVEGNVASARVARAAGFRRIRPIDATVPSRDGSLPAWHALRSARIDPAARASWNDILGDDG
jgi:RimJ/RimL family protein N-acetyltransferase